MKALHLFKKGVQKTGVKMKDVRIEWDGSYKLKDIGYDQKTDKYNIKNAKLNNESVDFGIYQIYGFHPVYGDNVLLYIGKANNQTFAKRISQENWSENADSKNIQIYVGRLFAAKQPSYSEWETLINIAEKMLIYAHAPAMNSSNILNISKNKDFLKEFEDIRIFNYDKCRSLMPEVSGELWIKDFEDYTGVFNANEIE